MGPCCPQTEPACPVLSLGSFPVGRPCRNHTNSAVSLAWTVLFPSYALRSSALSLQPPGPQPLPGASSMQRLPQEDGGGLCEQEAASGHTPCARWRRSQTCSAQSLKALPSSSPPHPYFKPKVPSLREGDLEPESNPRAVAAARVAFRRVELTPSHGPPATGTTSDVSLQLLARGLGRNRVLQRLLKHHLPHV